MKYLVLLLLLCCRASAGDDELAKAALSRTEFAVRYDGSYRKIAYPNGDVPGHLGVCSDLVVRSYRLLGVDLQRLVHEDMRANFKLYPANWGLTRPDPNIDHRRVPNLETFFSRKGMKLPLSHSASSYLPGDIVTWRLDGRLPHIGIVGHRVVPGTGRHYMLHNVGQGPREEDVLFRYELHGHYRYSVNAH